MFRNLHADLERYRRRKSRSLLYFIWATTEVKAILAYRLGRWLRIHNASSAYLPLVLVLTPVHFLLITYTRFVSDIELDELSDIGPGLYIGHFGGIRLRNCRIGANCSIHQEVCLVPSEPGNGGPVIGNCVWIGAHARVIGPIHIGDGVTVGAGAIVTCDVEPGCLVLGNPARVIQRNYDNAGIL